jgi:CDP-glycerol glycerophosphotransferase (TagB/SpsB family)
MEILPAHRDRLNALLAAWNMTLLVKPHPLAPTGFVDSWLSDQTIRINNKWLADRDLTLYGVLGGASVLVSDYSSVVVDFIATGRPCILYQPDAISYRESRGLTVSDDTLNTIGPRVDGVPRLLEELARIAAGGFNHPAAPTALWTVPKAGATARTLAAVDRRMSRV